MFPLHFPLSARKHDVVHPNDPVDNSKSGGNKGADEVRHHRSSAKSLFSLLGLLLRIPGERSIVWNLIFSPKFSPEVQIWILFSPVIETLEGLTLHLFVDRKQFFVRSPGKVNINLVSQFRNDGFVRYNVIYFTLKRQDLFWDINIQGFGCWVFVT